MEKETLIQVESLSRLYGNIVAVDNVSFHVRRGEILGFLGPNGAGKSTTMQMIAGVLAPTAGSVQIAGVDILEYPQQAKRHIGFLPEQPPVYPDLTVNEYLHYCAQLRQIPKTEIVEAVAACKSRCGIETVEKRLIGNLSKGYQQRVGIAQAIIHSPVAIILDEPTSGLDPIQIKEIRDLMQELGRDHSVILSTHILSEVQSLCDRVLIINQGKLVLDQEINHLHHNEQAVSGLEISLANPPTLEALLDIQGIKAVEIVSDQTFRLEFEGNSDATEPLLEAIVKHEWQLRRLNPLGDSLEAMFMQLTLGNSNKPIIEVTE